MTFDFTNKNVLVTGGSRGIGRACAELFAKFGANVIITYKSNTIEAENTIKLLGDENKHAMMQLNISEPAEVKRVFDEIITRYKRIDVVVNNAAVYIEHQITEAVYEEWQKAWHETIMTNLVGVSNLCYLAGRKMMEQKSGKIVNISSRGAFRGEPAHPAYAASKAGLNALSQSLAVALAPYNITVGVIAPGWVETDMAAEYLKTEAGELAKKQSPLNRVAQVDEVARLVAVFASEGFEYMTGGVVDLNGASYLRT